MMRHGETDRSESPEYRGQSNEESDKLNSDGRKTIRESAAFISRLPLKIEYIVSSDLHRTEETADIVAGVLGLDEYHIDSRLRPLNVGDFAGKNKTENPITAYLKDPSKPFPNGESVNDFENRQHEFASAIFSWIESGKIKPSSILVVCHDDVIGYWLNSQKKYPSDTYLNETPDCIKPGGVVLVTEKEIVPIHGRNDNTDYPGISKDGTKLSGFVTDIENRPPRECWNCRWFAHDVTGSGSCGHTLVRIDPDIADYRRQSDGRILVGDRDCCDNFQNHPST